jgi:hypothetical protein
VKCSWNYGTKRGKQREVHEKDFGPDQASEKIIYLVDS